MPSLVCVLFVGHIILFSLCSTAPSGSLPWALFVLALFARELCGQSCCLVCADRGAPSRRTRPTGDTNRYTVLYLFYICWASLLRVVQLTWGPWSVKAPGGTASGQDLLHDLEPGHAFSSYNVTNMNAYCCWHRSKKSLRLALLRCFRCVCIWAHRLPGVYLSSPFQCR